MHAESWLLRKRSNAVALLLAAATSAAAAPNLTITIYADNTALVQDTRDLTLTGGRQKLEFENVSAKIRSETVSLTARDLNIIEQNFDFDLLSPAKMMERAVGHVVIIVRIDPANGIVSLDYVLG